MGVTACVLLTARRDQARSLSLMFERYSTDSDLYLRDVAFLSLTNSSAMSYGLPMAATSSQLVMHLAPARRTMLIS